MCGLLRTLHLKHPKLFFDCADGLLDMRIARWPVGYRVPQFDLNLRAEPLNHWRPECCAVVSDQEGQSPVQPTALLQGLGHVQSHGQR